MAPYTLNITIDAVIMAKNPSENLNIAQKGENFVTKLVPLLNSACV